MDWPVSVVITPEALEIYAGIFSYLIQIRLAAFSLADVWCSLKVFSILFGCLLHLDLNFAYTITSMHVGLFLCSVVVLVATS